MISISDHIAELRQALKYRRHSPAFLERSNLILDSLQPPEPRAPRWRSLATPVISNDLGVRRFSDFRIFYLEHCKIASVDPIEGDTITSWITEDRKSFSTRADAAITFFGDYACVAKAITDIGEWLKEHGSYHDLLLSGTILAALSKAESTDYFALSARRAEDSTQRYLANHRLAASQFKRFGHVDKATETLDISLAEEGIPERSRPLERALKLNLLALVELKGPDYSKSLSLLQEAEELLKQFLSTSAASPLEVSMGARYASQIAINAAQIRVLQDDFAGAVKKLRDNCGFVAKTAPEYLAEALSELSCALYYSGDYRGAISVAGHAFGRLFFLGAVNSMNTLRKIVVASYHSLGAEEAAEAVARTLERDPLGFLDFGLGEVNIGEEHFY